MAETGATNEVTKTTESLPPKAARLFASWMQQEFGTQIKEIDENIDIYKPTEELRQQAKEVSDEQAKSEFGNTPAHRLRELTDIITRWNNFKQTLTHLKNGTGILISPTQGPHYTLTFPNEVITSDQDPLKDTQIELTDEISKKFFDAVANIMGHDLSPIHVQSELDTMLNRNTHDEKTLAQYETLFNASGILADRFKEKTTSRCGIKLSADENGKINLDEVAIPLSPQDISS